MQKKFLTLYFIPALLAGIIGYVVATTTISERMENIAGLLSTDVNEQAATLNAMSEVMDRGGVDAETESLIRDCAVTDRARFDTLLGRLNDGLDATTLGELRGLFDRCASFYARQKAVMASRFEREVDLFASYITRLTQVAPHTDDEKYKISDWQQLMQIEKEQSEHFATLVDLQGQIIAELSAGNALGAPQITKLLEEVKEIQEMQTYNTITMRELRSRMALAQ